MELAEVDGLTYCPALYGGRIRHLPRTQDFVPQVISYISGDVERREQLVLVTECRQLAVPPSEKAGEAPLFEVCADCLRARTGVDIEAGHTAAESAANTLSLVRS